MNDTSYIEPLTDGDFTELLIRHMILSPEICKRAKELHISGEDMMIDQVYGNEIYRELVNIINSVTSGVITPMSIVNGLKARFDNGLLGPHLHDSAYQLLDYFFDNNRPLEDTSYFDGKIAAFLKKRRAIKLIDKHRDSLPELTAGLNKLNLDLSGDSTYSRPRIVHPFRDLLLKVNNKLIGTGLPPLDKNLKGLMLGEYAILIGYSGCGKTAVGVNMVGKLAEQGTPSAYISCEEGEDMLAQRFYAHSFEIRYGGLRDGHANIELESKFNQAMIDEKLHKLSSNLCLFGLKGVEEITPEFLHGVMLQHYENTGFVPTFVMLDQMQFITPNTAVRKSTPAWELEKVVSTELDELSHRKIGGKNFVLWVQHQAKGKVKPNFSRDEIDGFKGVIHKADLVLGIGRAHKKADQINIFSLKTRHCAEFFSILKVQFEYMRVLDIEVSDRLPDYKDSQPADTMTTIHT